MTPNEQQPKPDWLTISRRLESVDESNLKGEHAALFYLGGGNVFLENYGRLCFCPLYGDAINDEEHATSCNDAWVAFINEEERVPTEFKNRIGVEVEIRAHPQTPQTHWICKVISKGRVYAVTWGGRQLGQIPSEADVRRAWKESRRDFMLYDESTGTYIG